MNVQTYKIMDYKEYLKKWKERNKMDCMIPDLLAQVRAKDAWDTLQNSVVPVFLKLKERTNGTSIDLKLLSINNGDYPNEYPHQYDLVAEDLEGRKHALSFSRQDRSIRTSQGGRASEVPLKEFTCEFVEARVVDFVKAVFKL